MSPGEVAGVVLFVVAVIVVFGLTMRADIVEFKERFPPISDAEFLAKCSPGTSPRVALTIRRMVAEHFAVQYERVHPDMRWIEDIGAD